MHIKYPPLLIFLFLFFLAFAFSSEAQILNIERLRMEKDTAKHFQFKTTFGLNVFNRSAGIEDPVNLFGYNLDVNAIYYPKRHAYVFVSNFDYLRINESDFLNFGFVHGRVNFNRENKVNYETYLQYSFDNFRGLDPRLLAGGSVRINMVKNDRVDFILGLGGLQEWETWQHPYTEEVVQVSLIKSSNYLSLRATLNDYVDVNLVNYYQVGYDRDISDFRQRINSSTIINTKITERFSLTNSFDISYENRPIVPVTNVIFAFRTGLSLNF
ncbi:DUF481 domain-containing protein [Lunatibacter salilacus]|uniref:DUF481 domain-containing protein n=1 Tax=Lunatibacter salilacus TaxID=2483804 RepID=UPI001F1AFD5C|nr:DUF481 domain-containing protein [Lunatibacter salilacus]